MKVIVCGAGQVGYNIARQLSLENHDVTVVDSSADNIRTVNESLDVQAIRGFASDPDVLERANAGDTDLLIAVTQSDEVNMVACQVAHSLFNVSKKLARVRNQSYMQPIWADLFSRDNMPIDVIISPELEVARAISRDLVVPGAFETIPMVEGRVRVIGVRCNEDCPVINTPLRQLTGVFPDLSIVIVGLIRDGKTIVPSADEQMLSGDDVYFVADNEHVPRAMTIFGHEERQARRIIIAGGGNVGVFLAQLIRDEHPGVNARIIEANRERAEDAAARLPETTVINGNALEPTILEEAGVAVTEAIVAVTNDDETNILGSLLAKRHGAQRAIALVINTNYSPLITTLGVDAVISPRSITASTILQHVRSGCIRAVHSLGEDFGEVMEAEILETSSLAGLEIREMEIPDGVMFGAVIRGEKVITPRSNTILNKGDRVVIFVRPSAVREIERLFAVSIEFF